MFIKNVAIVSKVDTKKIISVWSRKEKTDKQESIKQYKNEKKLENQTLNIAFQKTWRNKVPGKEKNKNQTLHQASKTGTLSYLQNMQWKPLSTKCKII